MENTTGYVLSVGVWSNLTDPNMHLQVCGYVLLADWPGSQLRAYVQDQAALDARDTLTRSILSDVLPADLAQVLATLRSPGWRGIEHLQEDLRERWGHSSLAVGGAVAVPFRLCVDALMSGDLSAAEASVLGAVKESLRHVQKDMNMEGFSLRGLHHQQRGSECEVELALLRRDGTWDRERTSVPMDLIEEDSTYGIGTWFMTEGPGLGPAYADVVLATVMDFDPQSMEEE